MKSLMRISLLMLLTTSAFPQADSLLSLLKKAKHDTTKAVLFLNIGEALYTSTPDSALAWWLKADELSKTILQTGKENNTVLKKMKSVRSNALNNIGYIYENKGNIQLALDNYNGSLRLLEELKDSVGLGYAYNNLGIVYRNQGDLHNARIYLVKSLMIRRASRDLRSEAQSLTNVGALFVTAGQPDSARAYYQRSIEIREKNGDKNGLAYSYQFMGDYYVIKKIMFQPWIISGVRWKSGNRSATNAAWLTP